MPVQMRLLSKRYKRRIKNIEKSRLERSVESSLSKTYSHTLVRYIVINEYEKVMGSAKSAGPTFFVCLFPPV